MSRYFGAAASVCATPLAAITWLVLWVWVPLGAVVPGAISVAIPSAVAATSPTTDWRTDGEDPRNRPSPDVTSDLPFGAYPHVDTLRTPEPRNVNDASLGQDIADLSQRVRSTVKSVASHRNFTCLTHPCLVQAFPIMYSKPRSGFFGGVRAKITDVSRTRPYLYSLDTSLIRSDTQQWLAWASIDFPEISFIPLEPRLKLRFENARSTETRYFGSAGSFESEAFINDDIYRFAQISSGAQATLIVPVVTFQGQRISVFGLFSTRYVNPSRLYPLPAPSKIANDMPLGWTGGVSARAGGGIIIDSRDQESLSRQGWDLEISAENSGPPLGAYRFGRITLVDRRYFSKGPFTLGHRLTVDSLSGKPPYWEMSGVGGVDPIINITGSTILKGYPSGRFYERLKIIESAELRWAFLPRRILGLLTQFTWVPVAVDAARLSQYTALSGSTGGKFLFNRSLLLQTYASLSTDGFSIVLDFGEEF